MVRHNSIKICRIQHITRGDGDPYLIRFVLFESRLFSVFLHKFIGSDDECPHCHPFAFISIVLSGGYWETIEAVDVDNHRTERRIWNGFGNILFRKATHRHRVDLEPGVKAVTLVIAGPKTRPWGFYTQFGWMFWRDYRYTEHCPTE
jgi:hypothetical protein